MSAFMNDPAAHIEQRTVIVSARSPAELRHADIWPSAYHLEEVATEVEMFGRVPIDLERVRGMLRQLQALLTPHPQRLGTCEGCGYEQVHAVSCPTAIAQGWPENHRRPNHQ